MKIAVLGSGHIGGTLGKRWAQAGHTVQFGVRNVNKPEVQSLVKSAGSNAGASSIADAINFGEVVLFAIPGTTMESTVTANAKALDGKIIIDATNNMSAPHLNSLATFMAKTPQARVYRAFNTYGWEVFENPKFGGVAGDQFYCGPDGEGRSVMDQLISDIGLGPVYLGGPDQIAVVDSLIHVWFALAYGQSKGRHLSFKVLSS